jgi:hypothetical protein
VAEGGGLLNRYTLEKVYRGFESLRLRQLHLGRGKYPALNVTGEAGCEPEKRVRQFSGAGKRSARRPRLENCHFASGDLSPEAA